MSFPERSLSAVAAPTTARVRGSLSTYDPLIVEWWLAAWDRWLDNPDRAGLGYPRTRANMVLEFAIRPAIAVWRGVPGVEIRERKTTAHFIFGDKLFFRLKKGDKRGL